MLLLTNSSDNLTVTTDAAVPVDVHVSWVDNLDGAITPGRTNTQIATATETEVVAGPAASVQRNVQTLLVTNRHVSSPVGVVVKHSGNVIGPNGILLLAGWSLQFVDGNGWSVFDQLGKRIFVGDTGATGAQGNTGSPGAQGDKGGVRYNFDIAIDDADPGQGKLRYNNAAIGSVTQIFIDNLDQGGTDLSPFIDQWDDSTSATKGHLVLLSNSNGDPTVNLWRVTGTVVDGTGYRKVPVAYVSGALPSDTEASVLIFVRAGDQGDTGPAGGGGIPQTFKGLHLRTHPDADKATAQVALLHADSIVMDDGTVINDWNNLSAIITSSGAGGLDTGAEAASTGYEIYAIRKSSDGTKNLLLHRAKDYFLDESQTEDDGTIPFREGATDKVKIAQTLDTDVTGLSEMVDAKLIKVGSPTGRVWFSWYATSAGVPTGAALKTSDKLDCSLISATAQVIRFIFRDPQTLTAGTTYALVLEGDYTASAVNYIGWRSDTTSPAYAAGQRYDFDGTTWSAVANDFWFKVYVTENDAAVTMPAGYDQKCKIHPGVYNDSGSDFNQFVAFNRQHRLLKTNEEGQINTTSTTSLLTSLDALIPPAPCVMHWKSYNTVAGSVNVVASVPDGYGAITISGDDSRGASLIHGPGASYFAAHLPILTEYQGCYLVTSAGTARFQVVMFEW